MNHVETIRISWIIQFGTGSKQSCSRVTRIEYDTLCRGSVCVCAREERDRERWRRKKKEVKEERDLKISFESSVPFLLEISFTSGLRQSSGSHT